MKYTTFHEHQFRQSVEKAMKTVRLILDSERHPVLAEQEEHTYNDKYALAEFLTNTSIAAQWNALVGLGLDSSHQKTIAQWTSKKIPVMLRFQAQDHCSFLKEEEVEVTSGDSVTHVRTEKNSGLFGGGTKEEKVTTKVVHRVKEYHWKVSIAHKLVLFPRPNENEAIVLQERSTETILVTQAGPSTQKVRPPLNETTIHPPVDTDLSWFFAKLNPDQTCAFAIERSHQDCLTPRRNTDIQESMVCHKSLHEWSRIVSGFFLRRVEKEILGKDNPVRKQPTNPILPVGATGIMHGLSKEPLFNGKQIRILEYSAQQQRYKAEPTDPNAGLPPTLSIKPGNVKPDSPSVAPPLTSVLDDSVFCPILPLFEKGTVLPMPDVSEFLQEQSRTMDVALDGLSCTFPAKQLYKLVSVAEASLLMLCKHVERLTVAYHDGIDYIEHMLKDQLVAAIGKEVHRKDFEEYMRFHNQKLFGSEYAPMFFSHAIRRPGQYPDGILSIEATGTTKAEKPIETFAQFIPGTAGPPIQIPINAATSIEIVGDRYLHGWMQHRFESEPNPEYQLACRARQFSSFLVILGTVAGPDKFEPKDAIILQNKDEVLIPLLTEVLPSAKEFKDAIQSLSPEQQEFAKAFRGMQLESSVFGVCVIQLKPQLEKLLGLPHGALTKQIKLTQELMSLFVEYQVPSDLLTFDGPNESTPAEKVAAVAGYVKSVVDVIDESKKKQLKDEEMKADMRGEMDFCVDSRSEDLDEGVDIPSTLQEFLRVDDMGTGRRGGGGARRVMKMKKSGRSPAVASARMTGLSAQNHMLSVPAPSTIGAPPPPGAVQMFGSSAKAAAPPPPLKEEFDSYSASNLESFPQEPKTSVEEGAPGQPDESPRDVGSELPPSDGNAVGQDFTLIPKILDQKLEKYDKDGALRSTVIKAGPTWKRTRQENFLTGLQTSVLHGEAIKSEKKQAFDLLDAISRSGTLPIECAELHVFVAVSHCFDNDVMGTVIQDNVNPISKVERSSLMLATAIYTQPAAILLGKPRDVQRLTDSFPALFVEGEVED